MPQQLESLVGFHRSKGQPSALIGVLMLAALVAVISASLWDLKLYYTYGASTGQTNGFRAVMGTVPWWTLGGWIRSPGSANPAAIPAAAFGAAMTFILGLLRNRFVGFPFVAAGYVLNITWANDLFWFDMLVVWVAKSLILRYGGIRFYKAILPFFLGLILGDFVTGALWSIIGLVFHLNLYRTFA